MIVTRNGDVLSNEELYDLRETPDPVENLAAKQADKVKHLIELVPDGRKH